MAAANPFWWPMTIHKDVRFFQGQPNAPPHPPEARRRKEKLYREAMRKDDYDWASAYALEPVVKDISCDESTCARLCLDAFDDEPGLGRGRRGVWGFWFDFEHGACPMKRCWLDNDWSRKEDVLHWKIGGDRAVFDGLGYPTRDVVLLPGAFIVESLIYSCGDGW
ncbi:hypothetical protein CP533_3206 [Ophiocordyceps camponoti-saundersi (nom. inval.)]|nr:hypothetical protein CP533_3206 [Ophiocordyceps camponoti-saundersi (nom. inval.)]